MTPDEQEELDRLCRTVVEGKKLRQADRSGYNAE
jgi:hypothetical protein